MYDLGVQFHFNMDMAKASSNAILMGKKYRITILTERLVRIEYSPSGVFVDNPTALVLCRNFTVPKFEVNQDSRYLEVETSYFKLAYTKETPITASSLRISLKGTEAMWYYGYPEVKTYDGTFMGFDEGKERYNKGLYSIEGFCSIDNSNDFINGISQEKWNTLTNDANKPFYCRYQATWAPGSSFKPVIGAIGLTTNKFAADDNFGKSGTSWQKDSSWGNFRVTTLATYGGVANLKNALIYSDNIYFAKAALKIGTSTLIEQFKKIGFNTEIPCGLTTTESQYANGGKITSEAQLANTGYGQAEVLVNPIHMAAIYSAFVNNGSMIKPYLEYKENSSPEYWVSGAFTKEAANTIKDDLIQVIENPGGTGHSAQISGVKLAGKTGTAEIKKSTSDKSGTELGWFNAFIADENSQKQMLVVSMIEDVKNRGGSHYVIPKVKKIFEY